MSPVRATTKRITQKIHRDTNQVFCSSAQTSFSKSCEYNLFEDGNSVKQNYRIIRMKKMNVV